MKRIRALKFALLGLDLGFTLAVFNAVIQLRGLSPAGNLYFAPLLMPMAALVFAIYLIDGYSSQTDMLSVDYLSQHAIAVVGAMLTTLLVTYALIPAGYELQGSRAVIALSFLALAPLTLFYRRTLYLSLLRRRETRSLVFIGDPASSRGFAAECQRLGTTQPLVFAVSRDASRAPFGDTAAESRPINDVLDDIESGRMAVEAIILRESYRELPVEIPPRLVRLYFAGVPTYTLELFHQLYWRKIPLYRLNQVWLFQEGFEIAREPVFERLKRATDIVLSLTGLIVAAPVIAAAGIAVWLEDRGSGFFSQQRIGRNHVPFRLLKIRTMRPSAGKTDELYTQTADPRITKIGGLLRQSRIDELPQLWNVLRGEMSLIGPRAEWDRLVENYEREIPCYHFRHLVRPGITGWAQVNYPYGANLEDTLRKLEYDLYYIRHFSFLLDASIVVKTIHIMLFGKGR
ncbi:MAG: polyprenyl glycosylphosphotransferase [Opitutia bacterium Tous-C1TDCM]|nr:MAG: polyprenyl glycosylphosphotransferase [Opitutae bacterium Tous-C1TDCM]